MSTYIKGGGGTPVKPKTEAERNSERHQLRREVDTLLRENENNKLNIEIIRGLLKIDYGEADGTRRVLPSSEIIENMRKCCATEDATTNEGGRKRYRKRRRKTKRKSRRKNKSRRRRRRRKSKRR